MREDNRLAFKPRTNEIPRQPGVYRFLGSDERVLYIGKAKDLRARLSNYFSPLNKLPLRTQRMLQLAKDVQWTVVGSDTEALILEHTWIGEFSPPFNVQFRDDKTYPSLAITLAEESPRVIITRNRNIKGAKYYGPFPKVWALKQFAEALQEAFPIRTCNAADYKRAISSKKPCLSGQIGKCHGPCSQKITLKEHRERVMQMIRFLNGGDQGLVKELKQKMAEESDKLNFEKAAEIRDQLTGIAHVLEQNAVVLNDEQEIDVFGITADELRASAHQFVVRGGRIRAEQSWFIDFEIDNELDRVLEQALQTAYRDQKPPRIVLVPFLPANHSELEEALANDAELNSVHIRVPVRGEKKALLDRAVLNAKEQFSRMLLKRSNDLIARSEAIAQVQQYLELEKPPMRIECVDISHLGGSDTVASLVVFEDAMPKKAEYRRYKVSVSNDDTAGIYEVIDRRAKAIVIEEDQRKIPNLFLIDGGLPQVNTAKKALLENGLNHIDVVGIAKRLEEIWRPDDDFPVIFPRSSEALFLLQRLRDEAHRFAISYQKSLRVKKISTRLTEIPGVGEILSKRLLKHFGSLARVKKATVQELSEVQGVSDSLGLTILDHLKES